MNTDINPIIKLDYPDPDVIRVGDTYFMVSTTMHFMPGCEILRSYDLVNWEHVCYVYETLDGTPGQRLSDDESIYGKGMWAACIRFHEGKFYICFVANDTHKTYLFTAENIEGPWEKHFIEGFYHDSSLLFDDDGNVYIVYGNKDIWITQLKEDLSAPKPGGLNRIIISDEGHPGLGYEGSHIYKINGRYYVFLIHSRRDRWFRTEACFSAESLEGKFTGKDVLEDDRGYCGQGVAQGGIVDTPWGDWYAVLFQDHGAVGRIPVLMPVTWKNDFPVFGTEGKVPGKVSVTSTRPGYAYKPLTGSDDFYYSPGADGKIWPDAKWQFNHEPAESAYKLDGQSGTFEITVSKICKNLTQAPNTLTQRMCFPACSAEVTIDAGNLSEGDYAGLCVLQGCYAMAALTRRKGRLWIVMQSREAENASLEAMEPDLSSGMEWEAVQIEGDTVRIKVTADFDHMKDEAVFYYQKNGQFIPIGPAHKLYFKMDHFTGSRVGLFCYGTMTLGGKAYFSRFVYGAGRE
ncbi:glycoside hydrolase 43 family protein [Murimonas intestini]|uniref:glycoside hydrolase family 43 protein n=1 Tax=Murimonas intestini TaxID=1337051 RepID=UPI00248CEA48|nr:glycoside hydrolase 43 family protein [Murimonas intestini]